MKRIVLDMDPGHDDALALLVALAIWPVLGVTTVAGNQTVDKTYLNARRVVALSGQTDLVVARGSDRPLFRELVTAPSVHGASGLDGYAFPPLKDVPTADAFEFLGRVFSEAAEPIDWIATGPLTNVARFLMGHPQAMKRLAALTIMGGSLSRGNVTPHAEFNIYVDPDAAAWVVGCGVPVRMVGLDVTQQALLSWRDVERFCTLAAPVGDALYHLFQFYGHAEPHAAGRGIPIHDVLAVAAVDQPSLFQWRRTGLCVERCHPDRLGSTRATSDPRAPQVTVAVSVDVPAFLEWLWAKLDAYRQPHPGI